MFANQEHPYYSHWWNLVFRRDSTIDGAVDRNIEEVWHHDNPEGFNNFVNWFRIELQKYKTSLVDVVIRRIDINAAYGPTNCRLAKKGLGSLAPELETTKLTDKVVLMLRKRAKEWPRVSNVALAKAIGAKPNAVSDAIRGTTFKHLDSIEKPYKK